MGFNIDCLKRCGNCRYYNWEYESTWCEVMPTHRIPTRHFQFCMFPKSQWAWDGAEPDERCDGTEGE